jgi:TonB family protein
MQNQSTVSKKILKSLLFVSILFAFEFSANAQSQVNMSVPISTDSIRKAKPDIDKPDKNGIYYVVEKMPQFPGGESELMNYIAKSIKYPADAQAKGIQGRIITRFVVNKQGKVEQAEIIRGVDLSCDNEALRVINAMPQFIPGEQNGEKVSVYYTLPITFKLTDNSKSTVNKEHAITGIYESFKITDTTKPLYIIDGKHATEAEFKAIKPENIKEISVLKNASAKAIYGTSGANGVVVITMKK